MFDHFLQYIEKLELCRKNDTILLAISGGIDSMVMLDLFSRAEYKIGVAHCNFGLRGKDSDRDETLVKEKASESGRQFFNKKFATVEYAGSRGLSIQMAARELRYDWFDMLRNEHHYDLIATAHHFNDSLETVLFNLARGTGLKGLTGIPPKSNHIIRPILFAGKDEIIQYAKKYQIEYREDISNIELKYHRNYIRNKIIPLFEQVNPNFIKRSETTLRRLGESQDFIEKYLKKESASYLKKDGKDIYVDILFFREAGVVSILYEVLKDFGFNYDQVTRIYEGMFSGPGLLFYSDTHILNIDRQYLVLSPAESNKNDDIYIQKNDSEIIAGNGIFIKEEIHDNAIQYTGDPDIEFFDSEKIKYPLKVRKWKEGDWFIPLGMQGKKKVSDFMIDEKIPVNLKKRIPVVLSGDSVIWVVGKRMDERFKITEKTGHVLKLIFKPFHD